MQGTLKLQLDLGLAGKKASEGGKAGEADGVTLAPSQCTVDSSLQAERFRRGGTSGSGTPPFLRTRG